MVIPKRDDIISLLLERFLTRTTESVDDNKSLDTKYDKLVLALVKKVEPLNLFQGTTKLRGVLKEEVGDFNIVTATLFFDVAKAYVKRKRRSLNGMSINDLIV